MAAKTIPPEDDPKDTSSPKLSSCPADLSSQDVEKNEPSTSQDATKTSAFKSLGLLDRFLALWIFLVMVIGIVLGNFVPNTGPALQKGKFVGVSVPIGMFPSSSSF
jgi:ACR3 family arsenite transporter